LVASVFVLVGVAYLFLFSVLCFAGVPVLLFVFKALWLPLFFLLVGVACCIWNSAPGLAPTWLALSLVCGVINISFDSLLKKMSFDPLRTNVYF
jgi:hypothetical protein